MGGWLGLDFCIAQCSDEGKMINKTSAGGFVGRHAPLKHPRAPVTLPNYLSIYLSVYVCMYVCLSVCMYVCVSVMLTQPGILQTPEDCQSQIEGLLPSTVSALMLRHTFQSGRCCGVYTDPLKLSAV